MKKLLLFAVVAFALQSCYYDKEDVLYPQNANKCDTINVTYAASIAPIMNTYCNSCHGGSGPSGGVKLDAYANVKTYADNGLLYGTVSHTSGSAMPKGGSKISDCKIRQIQIWVAAGAPNN